LTITTDISSSWRDSGAGIVDGRVVVPGDILTGPGAGTRVIRGSAWRMAANVGGIALGVATAALLLRHLGVQESGRYVTVLSLVGIAVAVGDNSLNVTGSRELSLRPPPARRELVAEIVGQRLIVMPGLVGLLVVFSIVAGYPGRMIAGAALAGAGASLAALANALLLPMSVELRNARLAVVDFVRQAVTLICVAALVAAGAALTPFFTVLIISGLAMMLLVPLVAGRRALIAPAFSRLEQRRLLQTALPMAVALGLGQVYFRLVIVLMSLVSNSTQTGYFGGSLRAMEALVNLPILVVAVALPVLTTSARDDLPRLRHAIRGLSQGAIIAGVLLILVTLRAATPVMAIIGGHSFRPAGGVLRIQVAALLFITLYQIWSGALLALGRQRELILTNVLALVGLGVLTAVLVPAFGAQGGAVASVGADALLATLIYWRLHPSTGNVMVGLGFLARVLACGAAGCAVLFITALPDLAAAALAGAVFLVLGQLVGMVPEEVKSALHPRTNH
jgi:O-antigen/teichoic acid export membrane protein